MFMDNASYSLLWTDPENVVTNHKKRFASNRSLVGYACHALSIKLT